MSANLSHLTCQLKLKIIRHVFADIGILTWSISINVIGFYGSHKKLKIDALVHVTFSF